MLKIKAIECNMIAVNCYIASDETKECVIIDCGANCEPEQEAISNYIKEEGLKPVCHLLTHGHFDHIMGAQWVYDTYGLQPVISERDAESYKNVNSETTALGFNVDIKTPIIGRCLNDGDVVTFGNHSFTVVSTPGHTPGSVIYLCEEEKMAFSGDTVFQGSIGRTDLPGGSMFQIIQSLRTIMQWQDDIKLLPGHGPETSVGYELAHNPYMER